MKSSRQTGFPKFLPYAISLALILVNLAFAPNANATTFMVTYVGSGSTGGSAPIDSTQYNSGATVIILGQGTLVKTGYAFAGWQSAMIPPIQPGSTFQILGNTSFEPIWNLLPACNFTLIFNGNGNTGGTPPPAIGGCGTVTLPGPGNMTNPGFTFGGWSSNPGGIGSAQPGDSFSLGGNGTLYAIWILACNFTLTFNGNGNTGGTPPLPIVGCGTVTLPGPSTMTKPCFKFVGWSSNPGGIGSAQPGDSFSLGGNGTLFAIWTPATFTILYSGNGNTGGNPPSATVGCGQVFLKSNSPGGLSKTSRSFLGWKTNWGNICGVTLLQTSSFNLTSNITLHAAWGYKITYNANGATSGNVPSPTRGCGTVQLKGNIGPPPLLKTGFLWKGWRLGWINYNSPFGLTYVLSANVTMNARYAL